MVAWATLSGITLGIRDREQDTGGHAADDHGERAEHRGPRADEQPGQHVTPLEVESEQMAASRGTPGQRQVRQVRIVRDYEGAEDSHSDRDRDDDRGGD